MSINVIQLPGMGERGSEPHHAVADNLAAEMARKRVSGRSAAKALGLTQAYVARRVSGDTPLDVNDLMAFARLLGIDPAVLLRVSPGEVGPAGIEPTTSTVKTWVPQTGRMAEVIDLASRRAA